MGRNKGFITSEETKKKMSEAKKGSKCYWYGKYGKDHSGYKGAISKLTKRIRSLSKYYKWKSDVLMRDDYTCSFCGSQDNLQVDHIIHLFKIIKDNNIKTIEDSIRCLQLWDINNGRTLCFYCHLNRHLGKEIAKRILNIYDANKIKIQDNINVNNIDDIDL